MQLNQYIRLGIMTLKTDKANWDFLNANPQIFREKETQTDEQLRKRACQLYVDQPVISVWGVGYKLRVEGFQPICIQYSQFITSLINFAEKQRLIICRPTPISAPDRLVESSPQEYLIFDNWQLCSCFPFSVQIWVLQSYLIQLTSNYEKHKSTSRNRYVSLEKDAFNQKQFVRILAGIVKEPVHPTTTKLLPISSSISQDHLVREEVNNLVKRTDLMPNTVSANSVVSFNFNNQNCEAGLFFDLDSQKIQAQPTPQGFQGQLRSYQARALTWMLHREGKPHQTGIDMSDVPYWTDKGSELGLKEKLFVNFYENWVVWKKIVEKECNGGILADDMGLGKTIMIIALILANRPSKDCKTLIIAPLSVIKQWQDQIKKFAPHLRSFIANQKDLTYNKLREMDIVIISQGKMRAQSQKDSEKAVILQFQWFRVVIDQAHNFKNSKTQMAKTVYQLKSDYRWCLTGTPTQNSLGDLFSLIKFLRFEPWCVESFWQSKFRCDTKNTRSEDFQKIKILLRGILLRRKKYSLDQKGVNLLNIPKVDIKVHYVHMNQEAKELYKMIDWKAQQSLKSLESIENRLKLIKQKKRRLLLNQKKKLNLNRILSLITKMRMISCHEFLAGYSSDFISSHEFIKEYLKHLNKNKVKRKPKYNFFQYAVANAEERKALNQLTANLSDVYEKWDEKVEKMSKGVRSQCLICHDFEQSMITPCLHGFCKQCIEQFIEQKWMTRSLEQNYDQTKTQPKQNQPKKTMKDFQTHCPYCQQELKMKQLFPLPRKNQFNRQFSQFQPNEKIKELMKYLQKMDCNEKALIFTSFLGMMKLICLALEQKKITHATIKGTDSHQIRYERISEFNSGDRIQVLILTLKTGSVGLNMEAANKVFFMDPWWNPAIEEQAIGRVHRLGQKKEVEAVKFITQSTIEARIVKLSLIKKQMSDSVLDIDDLVNDTRYSKNRWQSNNPARMKCNPMIEIGMQDGQIFVKFNV